MKVLIVIGSLRAASFSRKLAHAVAQRAPAQMECEIIDGGDLPLYNQDLDGETKPAAVQVMLDQVSASDALVFITPEYNYGIPGSLKNLIDWASRPAFQSPLKGTPALVMALSMAPAGGARAHAQLTAVLGGVLTPVFLAPSFLVAAVHEKFDEQGELQDEVTARRIGQTLEAFSAFASNPS